jgi:hypothetical protein
VKIFREYFKTGKTCIRNVGAVLPDLWREMQEDGYLHIDRRWNLTYCVKTILSSRKHPAFDLCIYSQNNIKTALAIINCIVVTILGNFLNWPYIQSVC